MSKENSRECLEGLLNELLKYGRPRVHCCDDGTWSTSVNLNTNVKGASGEIRSEFHHETPYASALQCLDRVEAALNQMNSKNFLTSPKAKID